jgi:hypothetical protein
LINIKHVDLQIGHWVKFFFAILEMPKVCVCGYNNFAHMTRHKNNCTVLNSLLTQQRIDDLTFENDQLKKQVECKDEEIRKLQTTITKMEKRKSGYNYIIHTREAIRMNENVYKIGRCHDIAKRYRAYPKGSILMYSQETVDNVLTEDILIKAFQTHFVQRKDYGNEYFEGDIDDFKQMFVNTLHAFKH